MICKTARIFGNKKSSELLVADFNITLVCEQSRATKRSKLYATRCNTVQHMSTDFTSHARGTAGNAMHEHEHVHARRACCQI